MVISVGTILLVLVILLILFAIPHYPYSQNWGYAPSGFLTVILVVLLILFLMGHLH